MEAPTYDDVLDAAATVREHLQPTLLYDWPLLRKQLGIHFFLKHENHLPTGAFKVRGGINLVSRLSPAERQRGIIGCTTGNHGQSLAFAAARFGVTCVLVVPCDNNPGKNASMRALGAELIEHGRDFDEAKQRCEQLVDEHGYRYVHSANEPLLIAGVGTMALEIFDKLPAPDVLLVPIGLGSGVCGNAIVAASRSPRTQVIGVQSTGAPAVADSWRTGQVTNYDDLQTFAEVAGLDATQQLVLSHLKRAKSKAGPAAGEKMGLMGDDAVDSSSAMNSTCQRMETELSGRSFDV